MLSGSPHRAQGVLLRGHGHRAEYLHVPDNHDYDLAGAPFIDVTHEQVPDCGAESAGEGAEVDEGREVGEFETDLAKPFTFEFPPNPLFNTAILPQRKNRAITASAKKGDCKSNSKSSSANPNDDDELTHLHHSRARKPTDEKTTYRLLYDEATGEWYWGIKGAGAMRRAGTGHGDSGNNKLLRASGGRFVIGGSGSRSTSDRARRTDRFGNEVSYWRQVRQENEEFQKIFDGVIIKSVTNVTLRFVVM